MKKTTLLILITTASFGFGFAVKTIITSPNKNTVKMKKATGIGTHGRKKFRSFFYVLKRSLGFPPHCSTIMAMDKFLTSIKNLLLAVL